MSTASFVQLAGLIDDDMFIAIDVKNLLKLLAISTGLVKVTLSTVSVQIWPLDLLRLSASKRIFQVFGFSLYYSLFKTNFRI
jgi:hypothetical protein